MGKFGPAGIAVAGTLVAAFLPAGASAADLGGDCCADLEERVAELEATAARKGNRKVSLTITGWVAEEVKWWDDGKESNTYVEGIGTSEATRVRFQGAAQITKDVSAGYVLELEAIDSDSFTVDQDHSVGVSSVTGTANAVQTFQSYWYLKSEAWGKIGVGHQSQASDNAAILADGSGSILQANWVLFDPSFFTLTNGTRNGFRWSDINYCHYSGFGIGGDCTGITTNNVRYDSPVFGGFSVSATWGEDDFWDVAAHYAGVVGDFKLASNAAYAETSENPYTHVKGRDVKYFQIGAYAEHIPTGLWLYGAFGHEDINNLTAGGNKIPDDDRYFVKGGLREAWIPLGHTVLYGLWGNSHNMVSETAIDSADCNGTCRSNFNQWGLGAVQEIDAAAMQVWVDYHHYDGSIFDGTAKTEFDGFDTVKFGALVQF